MELGSLQRFMQVERREDCRQPPGQHGLARTGRPHQDSIVTTGSGDLHGPLYAFLPPDVAEVEVGRRPCSMKIRSGIDHHRLRNGTALEMIDHFPQMRKRKYLQLIDDGGLRGILSGND